MDRCHQHGGLSNKPNVCFWWSNLTTVHLMPFNINFAFWRCKLKLISVHRGKGIVSNRRMVCSLMGSFRRQCRSKRSCQKCAYIESRVFWLLWKIVALTTGLAYANVKALRPEKSFSIRWKTLYNSYRCLLLIWWRNCSIDDDAVTFQTKESEQFSGVVSIQMNSRVSFNNFRPETRQNAHQFLALIVTSLLLIP